MLEKTRVTVKCRRLCNQYKKFFFVICARNIKVFVPLGRKQTKTAYEIKNKINLLFIPHPKGIHLIQII